MLAVSVTLAALVVAIIPADGEMLAGEVGPRGRGAVRFMPSLP
ncbi:MAG TPA: hypothetical protein VLZ32_12190 [Rhodanobacter sp.]|nr:hypothetical protein [Rhodanobacter sp.]